MSRLLEVRGLHAGYGGLDVVRNLDLVVEEAEVVALLGPNGAGKTTALLTIAGLLKPTRGSICFRGSDIAGVRPHRLARRGLVLVPDDRGLFPGLTVREHLELTSKQSDGIQAAFELFVALEGLADRRAGLLSGGEQQMLALATAVLRSPALLMIDEMSLGLAPLVASSLVPMVRRIVDETGCGVLLTEQHAPMALELADRAVVLSHGEQVEEGSAEEISADLDRLVSGYLGTAAADGPDTSPAVADVRDADGSGR